MHSTTSQPTASKRYRQSIDRRHTDRHRQTYLDNAEHILHSRRNTGAVRRRNDPADCSPRRISICPGRQYDYPICLPEGRVSEELVAAYAPSVPRSRRARTASQLMLRWFWTKPNARPVIASPGRSEAQLPCGQPGRGLFPARRTYAADRCRPAQSPSAPVVPLKSQRTVVTAVNRGDPECAASPRSWTSRSPAGPMPPIHRNCWAARRLPGCSIIQPRVRCRNHRHA